MEKILTIVIPTYNMQDYLHRCLDSLIVPEEQMQRLEVLVVNDGSKDNSSAIAHEYQDKYPDTFRVIDKENGNYGSCVNRGLKEATGKYIKILDADDWFDNQMFHTFLDKLSQLDYDLILTDYQVVNEKGKVTGMPILTMSPFKEHCFEDMFTILENEVKMHNVTYKRDKLIDISYRQTEGISYTDQEWITWPMVAIDSIYYINIVLYQYMLGREGQTMSLESRRKSFSHIAKVVLSLGDIWNSYQGQNIRKQFLKNKFVKLLKVVYRSGIENKIYDEDDLLQFDLMLKSKNQNIYYDLNNVLISIIVRSPYIKLWRRNKTHLLAYFFMLNRLVVKIYIRFLK